MTRTRAILVPVFLLVSLFAPLFYNWVHISNNCKNSYDFGIYQQAIYNSFAYLNLNPYITVRDVYILQDHFDPVYLLAGPWAWAFNYSPHSLLVFEWLFLLATLICFFRYSEKRDTALFWCFMLLWSRGLLGAFGYPIHPTTWAILPITLMCIAIYQKRDKLFMASFFALLFFKELFCLVTIFMGIMLLIQKEYKKGSIVLLASVLLAVFNFKFRELWLEGVTHSYGQHILSPFLENPWNGFISHLLTFNYKGILKLMLAPSMVLIFAFRHRKFSRADYLVLSFWLPLMGVHIIYGRFDFHYGAILCLPPLFVLWDRTILLSNKRFRYTLVGLLLLTGMSFHGKNLQYLFKSRVGKYCEISPEKRRSMAKVRAHLFSLPLDKTIFATTGSVPSIMRPGAKIYIHRHYGQPLPHFDYVLLGKREDAFPLSKSQLHEVLSVCKAQNGSRAILDDAYHLLLKGPISRECLSLITFPST